MFALLILVYLSIVCPQKPKPKKGIGTTDTVHTPVSQLYTVRGAFLVFQSILVWGVWWLSNSDHSGDLPNPTPLGYTSLSSDNTELQLVTEVLASAWKLRSHFHDHVPSSHPCATKNPPSGVWALPSHPSIVKLRVSGKRVATDGTKWGHTEVGSTSNLLSLDSKQLNWSCI